MRGRETDDGREKRNAKGGRRSSFGQGAEEGTAGGGGSVGTGRGDTPRQKDGGTKNRNAALLTRAAQGGA